MAAIAGIVFSELYQTGSFVENMLSMMEHRGSEFKHYHTYRNFQLGVHGSRIGMNQARTYVVLIDGVITNLETIKSELQIFSNENDNQQEILADCYEKWGIDFVQKIEGNFAIAILDQKKQQLFLIRDRIGQRPLYWYQDERQFIFASELKGLLGSGLISNELAHDAVGAYLMLGYLPQDMTPINKVNKLLPGYYIKFDGALKTLSIQSYWSYSEMLIHKKSEDTKTLIEKLDHSISRAIQSQLRDESKTIGLFTSYGIGSSLLGRYLIHDYPDSNINSYSASFQGIDEPSSYLEKVFKKHEVKYFHDIVTKENFLDNLVRIVWYLDEPLADPNIILTWHLTSLAAKQDNSFVFSPTGESALILIDVIESLTQPDSKMHMRVGKLLNNLIYLFRPFFQELYPKLLYQFLRKTQSPSLLYKHIENKMIFKEDELSEVSPNYAQYFNLNAFINKFTQIPKIKSPPIVPAYFDLKTELVDSHILQMDRFTSVHQLNWGAPFFDLKVIEALANFPYPEKGRMKGISQFLQHQLNGKFEKIVPKTKKSDALKSWIETTELHSLFDLLSSGILVETGIISGSWLQKNTFSPQSRTAAFDKLWALLILEVWFKLYVQEPVGSQIPTPSVLNLMLQK